MKLPYSLRLAGVMTIAMAITFSFANFAHTTNASNNSPNISTTPTNASNVDYRFKVHNKTGVTITKLMASDTGKNYRPFDVGAGVKPGQVMTLVWDQSTDDGACEWWIKAVYADGSSSPPAQFDFCEEDLVLEFT